MAVSLTELSDTIKVDETDTSLPRIQATVMALIEKTASDAPEVVKDLALVMVAGYLYDQPAASPRRQDFSNAMVYSGAASILSPWKSIRAIIVDQPGETS